VRSFSPAARDRVRAAVPRLVREVAAAHGLSATAEFTRSYPVTVNDPGEAQFACEVVEDVTGAGRCRRQANPLTGAEDFSYVLAEVPGAFVMLGACPPGADPLSVPYNHSADAVFDDCVLADGAAVYTELALRRLAKG
jgi:hippurate hydrolase